MMRDTSLDLTDAALQASVSAKAETAKAILQDIAANHAPAVFANSLGAEDMVLTDMIFGGGLAITVFSLDTGRLPEETHAVIVAAEKRYGRRIDIVYPRHNLVAEAVQTYGINGFYDSIEARKACCHARKVEPLKRVLAGKQAWITGLRAAQSTTRTELKIKEQDESNGLLKFSPLADWSEHEVWAYIHANRVPYNRLHDRNYPSIGCAPCTRAVNPGEDIRAGRWWWENPEQKECGLHMVDGRLQRIKLEKTGIA